MAQVVLAKSLLHREKLGTLVGTERLSLDWAEAVCILDHALSTRLQDATVLGMLEADLAMKTKAVRNQSTSLMLHFFNLGRQ